jgi:hypothetical protein
LQFANDNEVQYLLVDLIGKKEPNSYSLSRSVFSQSFLPDIDLMQNRKGLLSLSESDLGGALLNGPISIIVGIEQGCLDWWIASLRPMMLPG